MCFILVIASMYVYYHIIGSKHSQKLFYTSITQQELFICIIILCNFECSYMVHHSNIAFCYSEHADIVRDLVNILIVYIYFYSISICGIKNLPKASGLTSNAIILGPGHPFLYFTPYQQYIHINTRRVYICNDYYYTL